MSLAKYCSRSLKTCKEKDPKMQKKINYSNEIIFLCLQCNKLRCKRKKKKGFQKEFCCFQHKIMLLQHCSKIKSFWFYCGIAVAKTYFCRKIQYDFNVAHCLQHISYNQNKYDDNFSGKYVTLWREYTVIWSKFTTIVTKNMNNEIVIKSSLKDC